MITIDPPSQIWSIEYICAIPFFKKKFLENGFLEKKLFQIYNFLYLTKNHLFFLKFSKHFKKISNLGEKNGKFEFFLKISEKKDDFLSNIKNCKFEIIFFLEIRFPKIVF